MRVLRLLLVAAIVAVLAAPVPAGATLYLWNNAAGGSSSLNTNWTPTGVPGRPDNAVLNTAGTFTINWGTPDSVHLLGVSKGSPSLNITSHLGSASPVAIAGSAALTISNGTLWAPGLTANSTAFGQMIVNSPSSEVDAGSVDFGATGGFPSLLDVVSGGLMVVRGPLYMGFISTAYAKGTIHSRGNIFPRYAAIRTVNGGGLSGDCWIGRSGLGDFLVSDGGTLDIAGGLYIGTHSTGSGLVRCYPGTGSLGATLLARGPAYVGANYEGGTVGGNGRILIDRSTARLGGTVTLGDPDDAPGLLPRGQIEVVGFSSSLVVSGALTMSAPLSGRLDLYGGITQLLGGGTIRQQDPFQIGFTPNPQLWLEGGTTDLWPNTKSPTTLGLGRSNAGVLRVARPGTALIVHGATVMADSLYGEGVFAVDSSATAQLLGSLTVSPGFYPANVKVTKSGSTLTVQDTTRLGGALGGEANLTVDTLATATLTKGAYVGSSNSICRLDARNGGQLTIGGLSVGPGYGSIAAGAGGRVDVTQRLDVTGKGLLNVDADGVIHYNGGTQPASIATTDGTSVVSVGGRLECAPQLNVTGSLLLVPDATNAPNAAPARLMPAARRARATSVSTAPALVDVPLLRVLNVGTVSGFGVIHGRVHLDSPTATLDVSVKFDNAFGTLVAGDSTASDGFSAVGFCTVAPSDTLRLLDSDGADLGHVTLDQGVLQLPKTARLRAGRQLDGTGRVEGSLDVRDSAVVSMHGAITGDVALAGRLDLGLAIGTVALGSFHPATTGLLTVRVGRDGFFDQVNVTGAAALDGRLDIRTVGGHMPLVGDVFTVLTAGSRTGTFGTVTFNGGPSAGVVSITYTATSVVVIVTGTPTGVGDSGAVSGAVSALRFASTGGARAPEFALDLPDACAARVILLDVMGRQVATLANGTLSAGRHLLNVDAERLGNGVYFARAEVRTTNGRWVRTARAVVIR